MEIVHVKVLQQQSIAQHTQQKQPVIIKAAVLTKEQPVLNSQEHVEIIQQQYKVDVNKNHINVLKEHWLMEFIHVFLLQSHAQLKHHQTHATIDNKKMEKHVITQEPLVLHMICLNVQEEHLKRSVMEDVFGPVVHVLPKLVLQLLTQPDVHQFTMMMLQKLQFVLYQEQLVLMLLMPQD
jgi:hypothetical protein